MNVILGGIADWLHENGVLIDIDIEKLHNRRCFGIFSIGDKPAQILWIEGGYLLMQNALEIFIPGDLQPYIMMDLNEVVYFTFELADPGLLDDLLSKIRQ